MIKKEVDNSYRKEMKEFFNNSTPEEQKKFINIITNQPEVILGFVKKRVNRYRRLFKLLVFLEVFKDSDIRSVDVMIEEITQEILDDLKKEFSKKGVTKRKV